MLKTKKTVHYTGLGLPEAKRVYQVCIKTVTFENYFAKIFSLYLNEFQEEQRKWCMIPLTTKR